MASVVLNGDSSGSVTLSAPSAAGTTTQTLVATSGTLAPLVAGTAVASTSGTSIDFTGVPSWVKRITVMFKGVSTNATSDVICRIGSGSFTTTGYSACGSILSISSMASSTYTTGFPIMKSQVAASVMGGSIVLTNVSDTTWTMTGTVSRGDGPITVGAGYLTLSGVLDRIGVTTVNGTDTFDAGSINIMYE